MWGQGGAGGTHDLHTEIAPVEVETGGQGTWLQRHRGGDCRQLGFARCAGTHTGCGGHIALGAETLSAGHGSIRRL